MLSHSDQDIENQIKEMEVAYFKEMFKEIILKDKCKKAFYRRTVFSKQWEGINVGGRSDFWDVWGSPEDMRLPYLQWCDLMLERIRNLHGKLLDDGTLEGH